VVKRSQSARRAAGEELWLDPLELEALADKSAFDRARVYEAANLGHQERIEVEARVRQLIAKRRRGPMR
jgi:hypothetical protein